MKRKILAFALTAALMAGMTLPVCAEEVTTEDTVAVTDEQAAGVTETDDVIETADTAVEETVDAAADAIMAEAVPEAEKDTEVYASEDVVTEEDELTGMENKWQTEYGTDYASAVEVTKDYNYVIDKSKVTAENTYFKFKVPDNLCYTKITVKNISADGNLFGELADENFSPIRDAGNNRVLGSYRDSSNDAVVYTSQLDSGKYYYIVLSCGSTSGNISFNFTFIDDPEGNGNENAVVLSDGQTYTGNTTVKSKFRCKLPLGTPGCYQGNA